MPNKDRNKRSVRKARQAERSRLEEAQAVAQGNSSKKESKGIAKAVAKDKPASAKAAAAKAPKKRNRFSQYFADVRSEMHRVTWPSREELRSYSVAVIAALVVFGVVIWLVDTGFVSLLVGFTGLRG